MTIQFKAYEIKEERTAFPTPKQFRVEQNPSYLASVLAGVVSPIIHLPHILWFNSLWPFIKSIAGSIAFIGLSMFAGVTGRASGYIVTGMEEREVSQEEKDKAVQEILKGTGYKAVRFNEEWKGGSGEH